MNSFKCLLLVLAFSLVSANLPAVLMKSLPIEELSKKADLVVLGTVSSKSCQRDESGRIYTKIELRVREVWKGATADSPFIIYQGGGTVGNERMVVSGEAEYVIGEEVVAFLVINARGQPITLALAQGKFHVWLDNQTGEKLAHNVFHGAPESARNAERLAPSGAAQKNAAQLKQLKLNDLKQKVQEVKP
jgi:hypothetical protein